MTFCKLPHAFKLDRSISIIRQRSLLRFPCKEGSNPRNIFHCCISVAAIHLPSLSIYAYILQINFFSSLWKNYILGLPGAKKFPLVLTCSNTTYLPLPCQNYLLVYSNSTVLPYSQDHTLPKRHMRGIIVTTRFGMKKFFINIFPIMSFISKLRSYSSCSFFIKSWEMDYIFLNCITLALPTTPLSYIERIIHANINSRWVCTHQNFWNVSFFCLSVCLLLPNPLLHDSP